MALLPQDLRDGLELLAADRTNDDVSVAKWNRRAAILTNKAKGLPGAVRVAFHGAIAAMGREERESGYISVEKKRKPDNGKRSASSKGTGKRRSGHPGRRAEQDAAAELPSSEVQQ